MSRRANTAYNLARRWSAGGLDRVSASTCRRAMSDRPTGHVEHPHGAWRASPAPRCATIPILVAPRNGRACVAHVMSHVLPNAPSSHRSAPRRAPSLARFQQSPHFENSLSPHADIISPTSPAHRLRTLLLLTSLWTTAQASPQHRRCDGAHSIAEGARGRRAA